MLDSALNKGNKPPVIADRIEVVELEMGSQVRTHTAVGTFVRIFSRPVPSAPRTGDSRYWRVDHRSVPRDISFDILG